MADSTGSSKNAPRAAFALNPVIAQIVPDPDNPPKTAIVSGFLGASTRVGFLRIYLGLDLQRYIELPSTALLYAEDPDPTDELSPTTMIIDATANVSLVQVLAGSYLSGAIASAYSISTGTGEGECFPAPTWVKCSVVQGHPKTKCFEDCDPPAQSDPDGGSQKASPPPPGHESRIRCVVQGEPHTRP